MTEEQANTLNVIQEVLRGMTLGLLAMQPDQAARVGAAIQAFADAKGISPTASTMLANLAQGVNVIAAARAPKN
jgi:hypothetical protein